MSVPLLPEKKLNISIIRHNADGTKVLDVPKLSGRDRWWVIAKCDDPKMAKQSGWWVMREVYDGNNKRGAFSVFCSRPGMTDRGPVWWIKTSIAQELGLS